MKKIIVMLFLVLTVSIVIGKKAYAGGIIKKGHLFIYNDTPFSNMTVLNLFNRFWSKKSKPYENKMELTYYWVIKAGFKRSTHTVKQQRITGCFATTKALEFFKPAKYVIKRKGSRRGNHYYYTIINNRYVHNYKLYLSMKYSEAKRKVDDKLPRLSFFSHALITNGGIPLRSCNHRFLETKKAADMFLKSNLKSVELLVRRLL